MNRKIKKNRRPNDSDYIFPFLDKKNELDAVLGLTTEVLNRINAFKDQIIDPRNTLKFRHGKTWSGPSVNFADTEGEFTEHSHEMTTMFEDVIAGDISLLEKTISEIANGMQKSLSDSIFRKMHETTERTGNVIEAGNKTWPENLLELYEKIKLAVDRDGNISFPNMVVHPSQQHKIQSEMAAMDDVMRQNLNTAIQKRVEEARSDEAERLSRFESYSNAEA